MTTPRIIALDTETTGFKPSDGHRIVEFAAVEIMPDGTTGKELHLLFNPDREIPPEVSKVHGHTWESLKHQPRFRDCVDQIVAFLEGAEVWAHNAPFDRDFLQHEIDKAGGERTISEICRLRDSLSLSRQVLPKQRYYSLDACLDTMGIDRTERTIHTAIIDTRLLATYIIALREKYDIDLPDFERDVIREPIKFIQRTSGKPLPMVSLNEDQRKQHESYLDAMATETKVTPVARAGQARRSATAP